MCAKFYFILKSTFQSNYISVHLAQPAIHLDHSLQRTYPTCDFIIEWVFEGQRPSWARPKGDAIRPQGRPSAARVARPLQLGRDCSCFSGGRSRQSGISCSFKKSMDLLRSIKNLLEFCTEVRVLYYPSPRDTL